MNRNNKTKIKQDKRNGQSTLEVTVALVAAFILLFGAVKVFVWVNERMVLRQEQYEATRVEAASDSPGLELDESNFPRLDIFGTAN